MQPVFGKTIQDQFYYEFAKLLSKAHFNSEIHFDYVKEKYLALSKGQIHMALSLLEKEGVSELPMVCAFCGSKRDLQTSYLIPLAKGGWDSPDNQVLSCKACFTSRENRGIFEWLGLKKKETLHPLVAGKYLIELFVYNKAKGTLHVDSENLPSLCGICKKGYVCKEAVTSGELTAFCLESII